jgi:hypothetical protein
MERQIKTGLISYGRKFHVCRHGLQKLTWDGSNLAQSEIPFFFIINNIYYQDKK